MNRTLALKKLQAYAKNPELIKEPTMQELADLVTVVLGAVGTIEKAIKEGRLDGKTPRPDVEYLSKSTAENMIREALSNIVNEAKSVIGSTSTQLEGRLQEALGNLKNGKDGLVTEAELHRAAELVMDMIEVPDVEKLLREQVTANPELYRDGLELLEDKLSQDAISGLKEDLEHIRQVVRNISTSSGGTIGKGQVYGFIRQAIADGTITTGGVSDEAYGPSWDGVTDEGASKNAIYDKIETLAGGHDPVTVTDSAEIDFTLTGQDLTASLKAGSIDETKLDTSVNASLDLADSAVQPGDNISDLVNDAGYLTTATVSDGDKGDITVSSTGTVWTIDNDAVTFAKIQNIATNRVLARSTAGTGSVEDLTLPQFRTLINVEDGADVTDTTNVTAAGALMDSEVTNLAQVKAFDSSDYEPADATILKEADKTGADAGIVSGTAGTSGNLASWNVDGDLVDAGFAVTTGTPGKGSLLVGDGTSEYDEVTAGTNDQIIVYDSAQGNGVKKVDLEGVLVFALDGGGSALTDGTEFIFPDLPAIEITQITLTGDVSGSVVVDLQVDTYGNYPATDADSITASATPTLSSAQKTQDSTLTGWTTTIADGSNMRAVVDGDATSITRAYLAIRFKRNF